MKKQEKKFVLAALVLLAAITMVLLPLAGCKNDTVPEPTRYTVKFETAHGTVPADITVESGNAATKPTDPTKDGWTFLGWYEDSGLTKEFDFSTTVTADTTLFAKWRANPGTVVSDGLTIGEIKLEKTSEVQVLSTAVDFASLYNADSNSEVFISGRSGTIQPFVMGQYEVTQQLYSAVMGSNPSNFTSNVATGETQELRPVEQVSWYDAVVFCNKLSELMKLEPVYSKGGMTDTSEWGEVPASSDEGWNAITCDFTKSGYRLPTEAEWELAARGGNAGAVAWNYKYAGSNGINGVAWHYEHNESVTHEVGRKAANGRNLYDMSGNAMEWCWDRSSDPITVDTPSVGATSGSDRVYRGGAARSDAEFCTVFKRSKRDPSNDLWLLGFRLVRSAN